MYCHSGSAKFKGLRFGTGGCSGGKFGTVVSVSVALHVQSKVWSKAWSSMCCRCSLWRQCSRSICDQVVAGYFRAGDSECGLSFLQLPITSARHCVLTNGSVCSYPHHHDQKCVRQGGLSPSTHLLWCECWDCGSCQPGFQQCRNSHCHGCSCCRQRARRGTVAGCRWRARVWCGARHRCRRRWPGTSAVWHWGCLLLDRAGTPPLSWSRLPSAGRHSQSTAW